MAPAMLPQHGALRHGLITHDLAPWNRRMSDLARSACPICGEPGAIHGNAAECCREMRENYQRDLKRIWRSIDGSSDYAVPDGNTRNVPKTHRNALKLAC